MTKKELTDALKAKFYMVGAEKMNGEETVGDNIITHWACPCFDKEGDALVRQWVHFYTDQKDNAYWQDREPKPSPVQATSFIEKAQSFIKVKIDDGSIKYATIDNFSEILKKAQISAIMADKTKRSAIISADVNDIFSIEII